MVELASLHPLEAEGVPAQRRVRHELRLELADGDRRLPTAETAAIDQPRLQESRAAICTFEPGDGGARITNINFIVISINNYHIFRYYQYDCDLITTIYYCQCVCLFPRLVALFVHCARGTHLATVPVDDARDERRLAHA